MKFCAGWFDGEIWLNQTQDGTSFGVYEISAKNNNVPTKSRIRAKTSLQALCLSVRATASDSNSMPASFNQLLCVSFVSLSRTSYSHMGPMRFHPCTRHQRLITVPAHYGFFPPPGRDCCFSRHPAVLYIVRKASARPDAGGPAGTARSSKSMVGGDREKF